MNEKQLEAVNGNSLSSIDTAYNQTRQLDYYANLKVTTSSYLGAIKKYNNGNDSGWWLRGAYSYYYRNFLSVADNGAWNTPSASTDNGFAPAFRIG